MALTRAHRRLGRNFFWKSAAEGSRALQALYFVLLARRLGAADLGEFSVGFSAAMILAAVGDFGLNTVLTRQTAVDRAQGARIFLQSAYLKAIFFAVLLAGAALWPGLGPRRAFVLLFIGVAAGRNVIDQLSYFCLAYERLIVEAQMKFLLGLLSLGLAWFLLAARPSVGVAAGALLAAEAFAAVAGLALISRRLADVPRPERRPPLGWPVADAEELVALSLVAVALAGFSRVDISFLKWLGVAAAEIGNYFAAERVIAMAGFLPGLLAIASLPVFSRPEDAGHAATIFRLRRQLFAAGCAAGLALALAGGPLVALVYGARFRDAARPLAWLGAALPFMFVNHFSLIALIADKRSWQAAFAASTAFALNVVVDALLIPRLGILGAAAGAVSAQAAVSLLVWPFLLKPRPIPPDRAALAEPPA